MFSTLINDALASVSTSVAVKANNSIVITEGSAFDDNLVVRIPFEAMPSVWLSKDLRNEFDRIMISRLEKDKDICHYASVKPETSSKVLRNELGVWCDEELDGISFNKALRKLLKAKAIKELYKLAKKAASTPSSDAE